MENVIVNEAKSRPIATPDRPLYLGTVWVSLGALQAIERNRDRDPSVSTLRELRGVLARHAAGDHGDITDEQASSVPGSLHSVYGDEVLVVTYMNEGKTYVTRG